MSSSVVTRAETPLANPNKKQPQSPPNSSRTKMLVVIAAATVCLAASLAGYFWNRIWPFAESAVVQNLAEASDSTVKIRTSHRTYFPIPGCVLEGIEFHHGPDHWTLITIEKLTIEGSYFGILRRHVTRVKAEGGRVFIPPFGSNVTFKSQHSALVVEELVANGAVVEFAASDPQQKPVRFEAPEAVLHDVQWGHPIDFRLKVLNPEPPGEITTWGRFGAWTTGTPQDTPISGEYTFEHADLAVYGGIAGTLSSNGKYSGLLGHIDIAGSTDVPDFEVKSGGHKVRLTTQFSAFVDAIHGDTFLKRVDARFGRTNLIVEGSIAGSKESKGKVARLDLTAGQARIEDILLLFTTDRRSPMSGSVEFKAKAEVPSGKEPFLEKVKLKSSFGIDNGSFSKPETQKNVNELSAGARGENMEDAETVLTDLKGSVMLNAGTASFSDLSFGIPGASAGMYGTYNILNHRIDMHGRMQVDTKISKTSTGVKALLLKVMDPFFKKRKKGEVVPVHITGTYEHPRFGLDMTKQKPQGAESQ